jgi:hypothetical protein
MIQHPFFHQSRLSKAEWESVEVPLPESEMEIVRLLLSDDDDTLLRFRDPSLVSFMQLEKKDAAVHRFVFEKYFLDPFSALKSTAMDVDMKSFWRYWCTRYEQEKKEEGKLVSLTWKKADEIRLKNAHSMLEYNASHCAESMVWTICTRGLFQEASDRSTLRDLYTLHQILPHARVIPGFNPFVLQLAEEWFRVVQHFWEQMEPDDDEDEDDEEESTVVVGQQLHVALLQNAQLILDRNMEWHRFRPQQLYVHQQSLFSLFRAPPPPSIVFYAAPTGTGKTKSPIGLVQYDYCVLFVCAARHIGLDVARTAIAARQKVGFAFGCESARDVRLHHFAATNPTRCPRSGRIVKCNDEDGSRVQLLISDVQSMKVAIEYLLHSGKDRARMIVFHDEPTISMEHADHPLHAPLQANWNVMVHHYQLPYIILSCATLPHPEWWTGQSTLGSPYQVVRIASHDTMKSITLVDTEGYVAMPHRMLFSPEELRHCVQFLLAEETMFRYLDTQECARYLLDHEPEPDVWFSIASFDNRSLKERYLRVLLLRQEGLPSPAVQPITKLFPFSSESGMLLTTQDAHTFQYGQSLILANNVDTIATFLVQQSHLPPTILSSLLAILDNNASLHRQMEPLRQSLDDLSMKEMDKERKMAKASDDDAVVIKLTSGLALQQQLQRLELQLRIAQLDAVYVPNTLKHVFKYRPDMGSADHAALFSGHVSESEVNTFLHCPCDQPDKGDDHVRLLFLMGIGVLCPAYPSSVELVKQCMNRESLFMTLLSDDYIFGLNNQCAHLVLCKDLQFMTRSKVMQALGRVGRGEWKAQYTVRFRSNALLRTCFLPEEVEHNMELRNFNRLFA